MATQVEEIIAKINADPAKKSIRELRNESNKYRDALLNLKEGTEDYNTVLNAQVQAQGRITEINETLTASNANLAQTYTYLSRVVSGVVSGFNAVRSAGALLGVEGDALAETLIKIQAGFALTQALSRVTTGLRNANLAFKAFNATVASNPFGAAVIAITALVAGLAVLYRSLTDYTDKIKELEKGYEDLTKARKKDNADLKDRISMLKAAGESEFAAFTLEAQYLDKLAVELQQKQKEAYVAYLKASGDQQKKLLELVNKYAKDFREVEQQRADLVGKIRDKELSDANKAYDDNNKKEKAANEKKLAELKTNTEKANKLESDLQLNRQKRLDQEERAALKGTALIQNIKDEISSNNDLIATYQRVANSPADPKIRAEALTKLNELEAANFVLRQQSTTLEKQFALDQIEHERQLKIAQGFDADATIEQIAQIKRDETQAEIDRLWELYENEEKTYQERINALTAYNKLRDKQRDDQRKKELDDAKKEQTLNKQKLDLTAQFLGDSATLLGDSTAAGKALSLASATISTYAGAAQVLANPTELNPYVKWAQFATTITTGLIAVKNILATKIPGKATTTTVSTPDIPVTPSIPEPVDTITPVYSSLTSSEQSSINQRVFITESDLNEADNRVEIANDNTNF